MSEGNLRKRKRKAGDPTVAVFVTGFIAGFFLPLILYTAASLLMDDDDDA